VLQIDKGAIIFFYGSRARGDNRIDSDSYFLSFLQSCLINWVVLILFLLILSMKWASSRMICGNYYTIILGSVGLISLKPLKMANSREARILSIWWMCRWGSRMGGLGRRRGDLGGVEIYYSLIFYLINKYILFLQYNYVSKKHKVLMY